MQQAETEFENIPRRMDAVAKILAIGVVRLLTAQPTSFEKDSPNISHVGLNSRDDDRSL